MKNLSFIQERLLDSLAFARSVAETSGTRLATLPDLIAIRANTNIEDYAWECWFTPATTLYFGSHKKKPIIVVAHHLGPLTTAERLEAWGKSGSCDATRGGRKSYGPKGLPKITQKEFDDLVGGKYGEVTIIDFLDYMEKFSDHLQGHHIWRERALQDPLLQALCGKEFERFIEKHYSISSSYAKNSQKEPSSEEKILEINIKDCYGWCIVSKANGMKDFPKKGAVAFFLNLGRPAFYGNRDLSIATSISTHEDLTGYARFVVINGPQEDIKEIEFSIDEHLYDCMVPSSMAIPQEPYTLMSVKDELFVEYPPKEDGMMDTGEPAFKVIKSRMIGEETHFKTQLYGSPFLKYSLDEVKAVMPPEANAYEITGEVLPPPVGKMTSVPVQFYNVEIDASKRVLRSEEVMKNLSLLLRINGVSPT